MAKVKQDKAKGPRQSPSHNVDLQIPLALATELAPARRASRPRPARGGPAAPLVPALDASRGRARPPVASAKPRPAAPTRRDDGKEVSVRRGPAESATRAQPPKRDAKASRSRGAKQGLTVAKRIGRQTKGVTLDPKVRRKAEKRAEGVGAPRQARRAKGRAAGATREPARVARPAKKPALESRPVRALRGVSPKGAAKKGKPKGRKHLERGEPERVVRVRELDPFARCGPRTSVEHLIRVEERLDGESSVHLVFFDRHGWYCEHGKACRAVDDVRRHGKQLGLTF